MASPMSFGDTNAGFQAGIINGSVHTEYRLPLGTAERPETPPEPSILIPFSRDDDSIERNELFGRIEQKCARPGSRTGLVGLGGVGKSQLAIEIAYRTRDRSPDTSVFWVHASNAARFQQGFRDIADAANLPGRDDKNVDVLQLVHNWMRNKRKGNWLIILDNVDDADFLLPHRDTNGSSQSPDRPLMKCVPHCSHGSVLMTSRNKTAALQVVEEHDTIAVKPMDEADAHSLLQRKLEQSTADNECAQDIASLAAALEYMPLAIVQAAAFISHRAPRCSVREYLDRFQKSGHDPEDLLNQEAGQLRRDWEAKNSILITWQLTFNHIRQSRPSAADLLSLMSFFDRQGIPAALLRGPTEAHALRGCTSPCRHDDGRCFEGEEPDKPSENISQFEDDLLILRNYYFVSVNTDGVTLEMHRLVQLATQRWFRSHNELGRPQQRFVKNLRAAFPRGSYKNWGTCQMLLPHAEKASQHKPERHQALGDWAGLLYHAAYYAHRTGKLHKAEKMSEQAMDVRAELFGLEHTDTLSSMRLVAECYEQRGRPDAAEALLIEAIKAWKKHFPPDDRVLKATHSLASMYQRRGQLQEAEQLLREVIETSKDVLGCDHPDTLTSLSDLSVIYYKQGRLQDSKQLDKEVFKTRKKKLGLNHPRTLMSMYNLAVTSKDLGYHAKALDLMRECVQQRKSVLGKEHPSYIHSLRRLIRWQAKYGHKEQSDYPDRNSY